MPSTANRLAQIRALEREIDSRETEALSIYRPQPNQELFHSSPANERILFGGKRSGKTMACMLEFASIVTGIPIIGADGKPIPQSRPSPRPGHPRIYWIIGWDVAHIGQTLYKNLFMPGMGGTLYAIKDKTTAKWRCYDRTNPEDQIRESEKVLAGPMIPPRLIEPKSWTWNQVGGGLAANSFSSVRLKNGARIFAFPSSSKQAKAGDAVSGILIDEDIQRVEHFEEWQDRLGDEDGWLLWSVWPRVKNTALMDLISRADEEQEEVADPQMRRIDKFQLIYSENKYMTKKAIDNQLARMGDADAQARRDRGELLLDALSMYDFNAAIHVIRRDNKFFPEKILTPIDLLLRIYLANGEMPQDWTRYLSVDPSNTRTACHCICVPPPSINEFPMGKICIVEWELVVKKHSAKMLAEKLYPLMRGKFWEEFVMDRNMGRQTRVGDDLTVFQAYDEEFKKMGLSSRTTLSGFTPGCNVPSTRHRAVRDFLALQSNNCPSLILLDETTPETQREFINYRKKQAIVGGEAVLMDEPNNPRKYDCMSSIEYNLTNLAHRFSIGTAYVPPTQYASGGSGAYRLAQTLLQAEASQQQGGFVNLGPGSGSAA